MENLPISVFLTIFAVLWAVNLAIRIRGLNRTTDQLEHDLKKLGQSDETTTIGDLSTTFVREAINQSRASSWFSLIASTAGLCLIGYVVYDSATTTRINVIDQSIIQLASSAITTAISALFFAQSALAREAARKNFIVVLNDFNSRKRINEHLAALKALRDSTDPEDRRFYRDQFKKFGEGINSSVVES